MKTLDELRSAKLYVYDPRADEYLPVDTDGMIVSNIQAEIDRYYLPRPLFEDGEPVQWDEKFAYSDTGLFSVIYFRDGTIGLNAVVEPGTVCMELADRVERPPEPDTPNKLMADVEVFADACADMASADALQMVTDFLERQRRLDGVRKAGMSMDTQTEINGDATMPPCAYCGKHNLLHGSHDDAEYTYTMVMHLLARQRKIDGAES